MKMELFTVAFQKLTKTLFQLYKSHFSYRKNGCFCIFEADGWLLCLRKTELHVRKTIPHKIIFKYLYIK